MTQTITALFDKREDANHAVDELIKDGIPATSIRVTPGAETGTIASSTTHTAYDTARDDKGFWASLGDFFMPDEDRHSYAEALHRGSILVAVTVEAAQVTLAEDILEQRGTVDLADRETTWKKEGWTGYDATTAVPARASSSDLGTGRAGDKIDIVEEQLKVGKRQVAAGRVKVRSYVVETPVSEQINLRKETVSVVTNPVDRTLTGSETANLFKERVIEAEATSEEAVVSKTARVTGEVVVNKVVDQRTETVTDSVRSTKVDVDDKGIVDTGSKLLPR